MSKCQKQGVTNRRPHATLTMDVFFSPLLAKVCANTLGQFRSRDAPTGIYSLHVKYSSRCLERMVDCVEIKRQNDGIYLQSAMHTQTEPVTICVLVSFSHVSNKYLVLLDHYYTTIVKEVENSFLQANTCRAVSYLLLFIMNAQQVVNNE